MTLEDRVISLEKQIETLQNRLGQFLINSQVSNQHETKCSHTNTEERIIFSNAPNHSLNVRQIYTLCLDCKTKLT